MSQFTLLKNLARKAINLSYPVAKKCWGYVLVGCLIYRFVDQYFLWIGGKGDDELQIITAIGSFTVGILYSLWMSLLVPYFAHKRMFPEYARSFSEHLAHFAQPLTIESLRALGKTIVGFLLFIIPGVMRIYSYYFVSFAVQFDPRYDDGKLDALEASKSLWRKSARLYPALSLTLLFLIEIIWSVLTSKITFLSDPVAFTLLTIVDMALEIFSACVVYVLYLELRDSTHAPDPTKA